MSSPKCISRKHPRQRISIPISEWPIADRAAWLAANRSGSPFEPGGLAADWSEASRNKNRYGYGRWLAWLDERGDFDPAMHPGTRVTRDRVRAYLSILQATLSPFSTCSALAELGHALRVMAPNEDWGWISRAACRLQAQATSVRDKASRLQSPIKLIALGAKLMSLANSPVGAPTATQARDYRDGLLIAFLAYRPIRAKNLTGITCGEQLAYRDSSWSLEFSATETKANRPLEFQFPVDLVPDLEHYLKVIRPVLLKGGRRKTEATTDRLWISQVGTPMASRSIAGRVRSLTKAAFGAPICPHLFRDCVATWIAVFDPANVMIITSILAHATFETAERYYIQARGLESVQRYQTAIETRRDQDGECMNTANLDSWGHDRCAQ
jgi:integrase/recombinase XerD